ncbi:MAG: response regulator [bacterium]|nr:response regulator [bacterium]
MQVVHKFFRFVAGRFGSLVFLGVLAAAVILYATSRETTSRLDRHLGARLQELANLEEGLQTELLRTFDGEERHWALRESVDEIAHVTRGLETYVKASYGIEDAGVAASLRELAATSRSLYEHVEEMDNESVRLQELSQRLGKSLARLRSQRPDAWASARVTDLLATAFRLAPLPNSPAAQSFEQRLQAGPGDGASAQEADVVADLRAWLLRTRLVNKTRLAIHDRPLTRVKDELFERCLDIEAAAKQDDAKRRSAFEALLALVAGIFGFLWFRESWRTEAVTARMGQEVKGMRSLLEQREAEVQRDEHRWKSVEHMLQRPAGATAGRTPSPSSVMEPADAVDLAGMRVLVAEDGPDNQRLILYLLKRAQATPVAVENGQLAVQEAQAALERGEPYDVILMDMSMPVMDGFDATRLLRESGMATPIIALTAHGQLEYRARCNSVGCTDFLAKPFDVHEFVETLKRYAPARGALAAELPAEAETPPQDEPDEQPESQADTDGAAAPEPDTDELLAEIESLVSDEPIISEYANDTEMIELIEWFVRDLHDDLIRMQRAVEDGDLDNLAVVAHQLKGSAGSYGFPGITTQAERLELSVRTSGDHEAIRAEVLAFVQLCSRVRVLP